jgi:hypothetical protein
MKKYIGKWVYSAFCSSEYNRKAFNTKEEAAEAFFKAFGEDDVGFVAQINGSRDICEDIFEIESVDLDLANSIAHVLDCCVFVNDVYIDTESDEYKKLANKIKCGVKTMLVESKYPPKTYSSDNIIEVAMEGNSIVFDPSQQDTTDANRKEV